MCYYFIPITVKHKENLDNVFFSETRVPVINIETGARLVGEQAPKVKNLGQWLTAHPKYVLDIPSPASSVVSPVHQITTAKLTEKCDIKASDKIVSKKEVSKDTHSKVICGLTFHFRFEKEFLLRNHFFTERILCFFIIENVLNYSTIKIDSLF